MKKLLSVAVVIMTAALFFAGCSNSADGPTETLPGTWVSSVEYWPSTPENWTRNGNTFSYNLTDVSSLGMESGYTYPKFCQIKTNPIYGVKVKIRQNSRTDSEVGIMLFMDDNSSCYYLTFVYDSYILYETLPNGERTCLTMNNGHSNIFNSSVIKKEGQTNEVLFYTDGDNLVIKVNGTLLKSIPKQLDSGFAAPVVGLNSGVTTPINASWEFLEFQTAK